jgi:hypothetical protein
VLLFCTGTLMRLATGFRTAFCKSLVLAAAAGVCSVAISAPTGPIGVSRATSGAAGSRRAAQYQNDRVRPQMTVLHA